jgi:membrane protease subunit (stomatin/prohibitin family)
MSICEECPKFTKLKFCEECGCFMPVKVKLKDVKCPLDKWSEVKE